MNHKNWQPPGLNVLRTSLIAVAAALLLGFAPAHAGATNVVPNANFEQGGCGDTTPVVCGWHVDPMIHVGSSLHFNCGPLGCYAGGFGPLGVGASTDPAFCAAIGPGAHPASFSYQTSGQEADLTATFFQTADCTGASSSDTLSYSDPFGGPPGFLAAPPGTESALFGLATYTPCDDYCYFDADFYSVDVEDTVVTTTEVSFFTPDSGPEGTSVDIRGANFSGATSVEFDGTEASYTVDSDTEIHATVPVGATTGLISVTGPSGNASSSSSFTVVHPELAPTITSFTPTGGAWGTSVDIHGSNFTGVIGVGFGTSAPSFTVDSDSEIHATVPVGATSGPIVVVSPNGVGSSSSSFTVPTPAISSFSPTSGAAGTSVDILGSNFTGATSVTFDGTAASFTVDSDSEIHATVPSGATSGQISVTTPTAGTGRSSSYFTVIPPPPTISSFTPTSGPAGTSVDILGSNFRSVISVKFNGVPAAGWTFNSPSEMHATVPSGATTGPISVTNTGGTGTSSSSFTVLDATPETTIISGPPATTNSTSATIEFIASEPSTFECSIDAGSFATCVSPKTYTGLGDGSHTFRVRATDLSGNTDPTPALRTWTVDTAPPETTITSGPSGTTGSTSATFEFNASEPSAFECSLDGAPFVPCTSPKSYTGLADGPHAFRARATDAAGNADPTPATRSWTVDTAPPETTITSGPSGTTGSTSATFQFTSSELSTFECSIDAGPFAACVSPKTYTGLAEGPHTFRVRATDAAGNTDPTPAQRSWTVHPNVPPIARFSFNCTALACSFDGSASSDPDGSIATYAWNFGDGTSGSGSTTSHSYMLPAVYVVTLTVTDSDGATGAASQAVTLIGLSARGYKVKGLEKVDLSWSGGTGVDIYRNGSKIATVQGSAYTDNLNAKGPGTYAYKVCAGSVCSNTANVTF